VLTVSDVFWLGDYWGWFGKRSYHHTGPVSTFYGMREALAIVAEEGLDSLWARHLDMHNMLWDGLKSLGLESFVENDQDRWGWLAAPLLTTALQ
jgi:alanine-glyoxylate transaminase/serine-glyoxylate transaminase/serine-pyruvate transaminase